MTSEYPRSMGIQGRGLVLVIFSIVFTSWALGLILLRLHFRHKLVGRLGLDDVAILFSILFSSVLGSVSCVAVAHGYGNPSILLLPKDLHISLLMFYLIQIFYKLTIASTKISILLLYLRIFPTRRFRRIDYALLFLVSSYAVASIAATIAQCHPIPAAWDHAAASKCINLRVSWYFNGGVDMLGDILILLLPMRAVIALHLPLRQKLGLIMVFALGGFVCITSAVRMTSLKLGAKSSDPNRGTLTSSIWTIVEANTGIICACLPMLKTPVAKLFPTFFPVDPSNADSRSAHLRHNAHTTINCTGWEHFDNVRQELARPEPSIGAVIRTQSSSNEEISLNVILKTTDINVEYTGQCSASTLPQYNASNGPLTIPRAVYLGV